MIRPLLALAVLMFAQTAPAADPPAGAPAAAAAPAAKDDGFSLGEVRVITFPAVHYIAGSTETTFDKMMEPIHKYLGLISKGMDDNTIQPRGCALFIYNGIDSTNFTKPFKVDVGWIVSDKTKDQGELKVRKTEPFKCVTIIMTGPFSNLSKAYEKVMPAVAAGKHTPTGETREMYLYFEGPESPNNVTQIQVGIK